MQETSTLARPYACAVFKQAQQEDALAHWSEMLGFLAAVTTDATMTGIISDPRVEAARLTGLTLEICAGRLSATGENFVKVLVENRRLALMPAILEQYEKYRADSEGRCRVDVISAFELDSRYEQVIIGAMAKRLGTAVDVSVTVDKSLIGGVIIRVGDLVIDASLRGRLSQLALNLS